jgi:DNA repair photolyase
MNWDKTEIQLDDGTKATAQAPVIISASRSTDIPAFYADWFVDRWSKDYVKWKNPFNGVPLYVCFKKARLIVFWTKNPKSILKHLDFFNERNINYYFQYTLNDYVAEKLEPNVPAVNQRIETFIELSEKIGKEKVIWRNDPLILTDKIGIDELLQKAENIGNQLKNHTKKMVFSFADIKTYKKVQNNLRKNEVNYQEFNERTMHEFAAGLQQLNKKWNFEIGTCAENIPLENYGIVHNKCVDDDLMIKLFSNDKILMDFLGVKIVAPDIFNPKGGIEKKKSIKDKGQREFCGCIVSKDIGEYNTCPHLCEYCYANASKEVAKQNWKTHIKNKYCDLIIGV